MGALKRVLAAAVLGVMLHPRLALATTADGVLITNLATATYKTTSGAGMQTDPYGVTVNVLVGTPVVMLSKQSSVTLQASGGTVTFCISYSNSGGLASAFNVSITDAMPDNMRFVTGAGNYDGGTSDGLGSVSWAWSGNNTTWAAGVPAATGQGTPVYLRWTVDVLSQKASGFVCYTVSVM